MKGRKKKATPGEGVALKAFIKDADQCENIVLY